MRKTCSAGRGSRRRSAIWRGAGSGSWTGTGARADGEIDIVAVERHTLVVCEVKTRSGTRFGTPLDAVGRAKRTRLRRLAAQWLAAHGIRFDQIRIDVLGLLRDGADGFTIEHVRGVG